MNKRNITYWVSTGLVAAAMLSGGVADVVGPAPVVEGMTHLGYPGYFALILGVWKVLGGVAVLAPGFPRLKEWAYAGIVFDLSGAALSHAFAGDGADKIVAPIVLLGLAFASWALRPDSRRLADGAPEERVVRGAEPVLTPRTA